MIKEAKDVLESVLTTKCGINEKLIARSAYEKEQLQHRKQYPFASLISMTGRYEEPNRMQINIKSDEGNTYVQARALRVLPIRAVIEHKDEESADALFSTFLGSLPFSFEIDGVNGTITPTTEEHSDFISSVHGHYQSAVLMEFSIEAYPVPQAGYPIEDITTEGEFEDGEE